MIVDRSELEPIVKGKQTEVHLRPGASQHPPQPNTFQAIQGAVGKRATCTVHIDSVRPEKGGYVVAFHLAEDVPARLLGKSGGYTTDSRYAMPDGEGGVEPEAVNEETQDRITAEAKDRARNARKRLRQDQNLLAMEDRVRAYQREAAHKRIDIGKEMRTFDKLKLRGKDPANQVHVIRRKLDDHEDRRAA